MNNISRMRELYKPEIVKVLFLAESPPVPESDDNEVRFFYNHRQERWDHMYRSVMQAVFPDYNYRRGEKAEWLGRFRDNGYYLIDATDTPINHFSSAERRRVIKDSLQKKLSEIAELVNRQTPIILIKKNIFLAFNGPLRSAGYNVTHESFLPFPSHGHQRKFIENCRQCLRNLNKTTCYPGRSREDCLNT